MTHSLHRRGSAAEEKDYVWFMYQSQGINDDNIPEKARKFLAVVESVGSVNWGDVKTGPLVSHSRDEIVNNIGQQSRLRGVFTSKDQIVDFMKKIKEADIGLSVVVTGVTDIVVESCKEAGVTPHTINFSLGIFGNKDRLPDETTMSITTMCGHHLVPDKLVDKMREDVRKGRISADKAALELATYCPCGIFNQIRAEEILKLEQALDSK